MSTLSDSLSQNATRRDESDRETGKNNEDGKTKQDPSWFLPRTGCRSQHNPRAGVGMLGEWRVQERPRDEQSQDQDLSMHRSAGEGGEVLLCRTAGGT